VINGLQGIVCPACYHKTHEASLAEDTDDYGRERRLYFGWCSGCHKCFEVMQYNKDGKWVIHKFRWLVEVGKLYRDMDFQWQIVSEPPQVAPVATGPGGDYRKGYDIKTSGFVEKVYKILTESREAIGRLLQDVRERHE